MATNTIPKAKAVIADLSTVADQIEASQESDKGTQQIVKSLRGIEDRILGLKGSIVESNIADDEKVLDIVSEISRWADELSPAETLTWDAETVTTKLNLLASMDELGFLSDEESEEFEIVNERLSAIRSRRRSTSTPQAAIEGKAYRVSIMAGEDKVANQAGNKASSVPNLKAAVKRYLESNGIEFTDEMSVGVGSAIKQVVDMEAPTAEFGGMVITAISE